MKKGPFAALMCLALLLALPYPAARAATHNVNVSYGTVHISVGWSLIPTEKKLKLDYTTSAGGSVTEDGLPLADTVIHITGRFTAPSLTDDRRIIVDAGLGTASLPVQITLDNVTLKNWQPSLEIGGTSSYVELTLVGASHMTNDNNSSCPAIQTPSGSTLAIQGGGSLAVTIEDGGNDCAAIGNKGAGCGTVIVNSGVLEATSGGGRGAAIGGRGGGGGGSGRAGESGGTVIVNGGTLKATSNSNSNSAAIGGGGASGSASTGGDGGTMTINGGTVTATSNGNGAAIGGGNGDLMQGGEVALTISPAFFYEWTRTAGGPYKLSTSALFENNNDSGFVGIRPASPVRPTPVPTGSATPPQTGDVGRPALWLALCALAAAGVLALAFAPRRFHLSIFVVSSTRRYIHHR